MIRLRAHHLLCSATFTGQGYTKKFIDNYHLVVKRLSEDELIEVVSGPDDICAPVCADPNHHCYKNRITERDKRVFEDFSKHTDLDVNVGSILKPSRLFNSEYRKLFASGLIRNGCTGCQWKLICDDVAGSGFSDTVLRALVKE